MARMDSLAGKQQRLHAVLRDLGRVAVAFSGGVDSAVVAHAAHAVLGADALAITADSPSVARAELDDARRIAAVIGIAHRIVATHEFDSADYERNDGTRCYYCKDELYGRIQSLPELDGYVVVSGANVDDAGDYRPGLSAAAKHRVRHPLQEAGLTKAEVRELAKQSGLDVWDKPASPCLSSRIAPGVPATADRTARIEAAEKILKEMGLRECRVRLHEGELARIEVPADALVQLAECHQRLDELLRGLGFRYVTLDLGGFRSGSLNELITLETRRKYTPETAT
ncbi:MAG: ATP-dependent sacrificial sulfur transferase LarE [Gemmataceae bacterium]|nr:ATP-dependent sacrificial sulfur transferase LarE [Gemmataceae bacterium]